MCHRIIVVIFTWLVCFSSNAQQAERRVALVIGNSSYKSSPLKNPVNDARDMANSLRGYGFTVIERTNLTTRQVGQTLREFRSKLIPGSVAVVFYAGHGVQIKGENYLPTVDAEINGEEDVPMQSLSTRQVMDVLGEAKTRMNLVFLDACRDNPYARSFRSGSRGIAKENAPSGTLISFATRPGSVAGDGDGRNGLYTSVLLEQIKQSNQPIEQVLKRVVTGVKVASKGQQEPWMEGSIEGDFCFGNCGANFFTEPAKLAPIPVASSDSKFNTAIDLEKSRAFNKASEIYRDLASSGHAKAQVHLAKMYRDGRGVDIDFVESNRYLKQAVYQNDAEAQMLLGVNYALGVGGLDKDLTESVRLFRLSADQGHPVGQANLGLAYMRGDGGLVKDEYEAVRIIRLAAAKEVPLALNMLGSAYLSGSGGLNKDPIEAVNLYRKASDKGLAAAQFNLGRMYEQGLGGLGKDLDEAKRLYRLSAKQNNSNAQGALSRLGDR